MSQITLTERERTKALQEFGYTETEAQFLLLPALHGGYFLRRQYGQFLGREDGGTVTRLVQKALGLGHCKASTWRQNTQLYHLCSRPFYEAIRQGDNRNRRMRERNAIKAKIMGLDFVLAHADKPYLATDQEKVDYFTRVLHIDLSNLPSIKYKAKISDEVTSRYFIEKFPISVAGSPSISPVVTFCFIDEGLVGLSAFETFLSHYYLLFSALNTFELIYVAASRKHFEAAQRRFERLTKGETLASLRPPVLPESLTKLVNYFEIRRAYETDNLAGWNRGKLIAFRNAREAFSGKEFEALYKVWRTEGLSCLQAALNRQQAAPTTIRGRFSTYLLEHDYGLFATIAAA